MKPAANRRKPAITVSRTDHARLTRLAESLLERNAELADELLSELERARVVNDDKIGDTIIRIGSHVRYETDSGDAREVTLVLPGDADINDGKVSILTPIGTALIGLSEGQAIDWTARDGRVHRLMVQTVTPAA
ncbi:MAG TPA: nucleoside diphosphate kinase regulator [Rhizobiaceae bacterium]|nr:nucleoside diphosphate kinase regulator [Rhizobiaceae bacterium]